MQPHKIQGYGYRRDFIDHRDTLFKPSVATLPDVVDLSAHMPPVLDQGQLGACTAHGITEAVRYDLIKNSGTDHALSRLQLYYDERAMEGTVESDAGAAIRDGIKTLAANGVALEALWPYNIAKFKEKPSPNVYADAKRFRALKYSRVGKIDGTATAIEVKTALAEGYPVVFGFTVFDQFESAQCAHDGLIAMPGFFDRPIGGHCTLLKGYGQKPGRFTGRNSWGANWGDKGDYYMPDAFLEKYGSDFWIVTGVNLETSKAG